MSIWRRSTTGILIAGVVVTVVASAIAFIALNFQPRTEIRLGSSVFQARLATDNKQREEGLSGIDNLGPNEALLMVFPGEGKWSIWMKDMKVALDVVWLDNDKNVVYIVKNIAPHTSADKIFAPKEGNALYIVELPGGSVDQAGIKMGEKAVFTLPEGLEV